ncbi:peptidoglycan-binding LysM [Kalymmatonema gypsitolerans NIES-4073]|nr:peptidoglycan-binding LysM [Scytonema sp. NIES-4073]
MTLEKLRIVPQPPSRLAEIEVLFNPTAYSISKSVTWSPPENTNQQGNQSQTQRALNAPILTFGGGDSRQLTLELFFDVTEPMNGRVIDDVRQETNKIVALTRIERVEPPRPPTCLIFWGNSPPNSDFPFRGVVSSLTQNFTLFKSNGKPVRANLAVSFTEFLDPDADKRQTDPELTTRIVKAGDTLSGIAAEVYRDPKRWRIIAEENRLDDPRHLQPGQRLTIPKL